MKFKIIFILIISIILCACSTNAQITTIHNAIENATSLNGITIAVEGFVYLDFETKFICEEPEYPKKCLWLKIPQNFNEIENTYQIKTGSKIIATGVFKAQNINLKKAEQGSGITYVQIRPQLHLLQKVKIKKL